MQRLADVQQPFSSHSHLPYDPDLIALTLINPVLNSWISLYLSCFLGVLSPLGSQACFCLSLNPPLRYLFLSQVCPGKTSLFPRRPQSGLEPQPTVSFDSQNVIDAKTGWGCFMWWNVGGAGRPVLSLRSLRSLRRGWNLEAAHTNAQGEQTAWVILFPPTSFTSLLLYVFVFSL